MPLTGTVRWLRLGTRAQKADVFVGTSFVLSVLIATRFIFGFGTKATQSGLPRIRTHGGDKALTPYCVIPTEVGMPTARTTVQGQRNEDDKLARHLDWADENKEAASIRMAAYQQKVAAYYNRKVRPRVFKEGSLVLRKIFENTVEKGAGKLQANWEGPYVVIKANEKGSYHLQTLNGTSLLRPWNVANLKQYYQ